MEKRVITVIQYNSRIISIKMDTKFINTFVIQVYMPTSRHGDYEIEEMYEEIDEVIKLSKGKDNMIVIGDRNAVVGKEQCISGDFWLRKINQREERLIEFCMEQT